MSQDVEQWVKELTAAGWKQVMTGVWKSPSGYLFRGPYKAWEPAWVSVEKQSPPRHQNVWCLNRDGYSFEGRICCGMHKPFFTYPRGDGSPSNTAPNWIDVTHWRPLPEPPKAGQRSKRRRSK